LKTTTYTAPITMGTADTILTAAPDGTPSGGWKEFAVRRNVPTSVTRKPAQPLAATVPLYHRPRWRTTFSRSRSPSEVQSRAWKKIMFPTVPKFEVGSLLIL